MDPVGFSVGIIGLAGLVSTAIEGFDTFRKMRAFGRDKEMLAVKLDIEKNLLMQWALRVGLLKRNLSQADSRLHDRHTRRRIYRILDIIDQLIRDGDQLEQKYGLYKVLPSESDFANDAVSKHGMKQLVQGNEVVLHGRGKARGRSRSDCSVAGSENLGSSYGSERSVGLVRKFVWAIHDKEEFRELIEQVEYFVSKLDEMVPPISDEQRHMMNETLRDIGPDAPTLRLISLAAKGLHDEWSEAASSLADQTETTIGLSVPTYTRRRHSRSSDERGRSRNRLEVPNDHRRRSSVRRSLSRMRKDLLLIS